MSGSAALSPLPLSIAGVRELFHAFGAWWLREFLDLFPQRLAHWLVDNGGRTLVLASEGDAIALHLTTDRGRLLASSRVTRADYSPELIDEFLAKQRHRRTSVTIGLSLPEELIFQRSFILPLETRRTLDTVVVQDLLAKTPFQLDDIYHAHRVDRAGGKLVVSQCVVRRAHAAAAAGTFDLKPEDIAFIQPDNTAHHADQPRIVTTSPSSIKRNHWAQRIGVGLVATALLLAIWGLGTRYHRQQVVLDALQTEVAAAAAKAKSVQGMIEKLRSERALLLRLRAKRDEPGLGDIWEEATRILPAHTWLTELRLSETPDDRHLVMTGFSAAAASLVGLLDRSSVFGEASLVGPTTVDPTEAKERFIIQAKLKRPASSKTPSQ